MEKVQRNRKINLNDLTSFDVSLCLSVFFFHFTLNLMLLACCRVALYGILLNFIVEFIFPYLLSLNLKADEE